MIKAIQTVFVSGLGLIGGSLCLGIKGAHPEIKIIGLDPNQDSQTRALKAKGIDEIAASFEAAVLVSDVVLLCTPVQQTIKLLQQLEQLPLKKAVIVSDVGSTKSAIMDVAENLTNPAINFIGGHPMAGSHKSGFIAADVDLFENAYYILTPTQKTTNGELLTLQHLLKGTRAKFLELTATEHDRITGVVSHLPHIIASGLVNHNQQVAETLPLSNQLAAGGFRDITRIASSDPIMWTDILLSNRLVLTQQLNAWQVEMTAIQQAIESGDKQTIFNFFTQAKNARDSLPERKKGAIPAFNDLFVEVPDYSGQIAKITGILAEVELSLTNLKILENREDIFGTLQLTFKNQKDVTTAKDLLEKKGGYICYEK